MSHKEEDICMSYEEEFTCMSYGADTCKSSGGDGSRGEGGDVKAVCFVLDKAVCRVSLLCSRASALNVAWKGENAVLH